MSGVGTRFPDATRQAKRMAGPSSPRGATTPSGPPDRTPSACRWTPLWPPPDLCLADRGDPASVGPTQPPPGPPTRPPRGPPTPRPRGAPIGAARTANGASIAPPTRPPSDRRLGPHRQRQQAHSDRRYDRLLDHRSTRRARTRVAGQAVRFRPACSDLRKPGSPENPQIARKSRAGACDWGSSYAGSG
jgi:hypothetical protein